MPQSSQIIGVNSVTNIEPGNGVMPAPVFRNADWLEKFVHCHIYDRAVCPAGDVSSRPKVHAMRIRSLILI